MSFRARLMALLTGFLLLTIVLVLALDKWAQRRIDEEIGRQNQRTQDAAERSLGALAQAHNIALQALNSDKFLYETLSEEQLPPTIEHIIITDKSGLVIDCSRQELIKKPIVIPKERLFQEKAGDPVQEEPEFHGGLPRTYFYPTDTTKGPYWIVIVEDRQPVISQIEDTSRGIERTTHRLSLIRIWATAALLVLALAIAVVIGWRFTQPFKELAGAARRVAGGDLDFQLPVGRLDEVGQLASTFNEMITDLKSKRELEEKLNQAERAAVIGRLTQSIAHEIRNPLNVLNLSIDHVSTKFAPDDEKKRQQFTRILGSVKDEIARLNRMVSDVLNYGRPANLAATAVDMRLLVEETAALIRAQAEEQGVEIRIEEASVADSPAVVRGDRERLKSCLSNIAINALQVMPAGGRLTARVARTDGLVEISITDTGPGISEEEVGRIFEPYFSTKQSGFGLGLAVTKKIVEDHRGSIHVESNLDHGTTFVLRLPAASDRTAPDGGLNDKE